MIASLCSGRFVHTICVQLSLSGCRLFSRSQLLQTVEMQAGVEYDPGDQKAGERGHETLLHQFPDAAVRLLVNLLEIDAVHVDDAAVDGRKS